MHQQVAMVVLEVFCGLIGWFSLYLLFCSICPHRGSEWNCRLVTLSHGIIIVLLTAYVVFVDGPWPFTHAGEQDKIHKNVFKLKKTTYIKCCITKLQTF